METVKWIVSFVALVSLVSALPKRIHVGGLFDADDEEMELAFRIAVDWLNSDENLLKNSRVITSIEKLHSEDSFKATKICCELLQNGITALFGPQSELASKHVQSICDDLEVPHINSRWEYRMTRDQLSVNLYPRLSVVSKAFVRLLEIWHWKEFYLVYEEDDAIVRLQDFMTEGEKRNWTIQLYKFPNETSYREIFWQIKLATKMRKIDERTKRKPSPESHIVLDVPREHLYKVMKSAQQVGMMTELQKYLITSLDFHTIDLEDFQYGKTNITGLRLVQEETEEFQNVLKEMNHRLYRRKNATALNTLKTETALIFDSVRLLAHALEHMDTAKNIAVFPPISCDLMNKGVDGTSLVNYMKNVKMGTPGLTGLLEFDSEGFRSRISLDIVYLTKHGLKKIGTIHPGNVVNVTTPGSSDFQYLELETQKYRVTTFLNDPYAMLKESKDPMTGNDRYEGYGIDVMNALAERLHFTYEMYVTTKEDGGYGGKDDKTGLWTGMIGEVHYGRADMAIADLTITSSRMKGVDFTLPFMQTGISILFRKPTEKASSLFSFLLPFSGEVWLLTIAAYCFISILLFLVGRISPYEWSNPYPCRETNQVEENCFSLLNSMWWAVGSLLCQGSDVSPTASSTRALTSMWSFFRLIMVSSYTANLAAFLTVEKLVSPFESVEDLAKQEKIKYGCVATGSTKRFFKESNLTTYQKMAAFMDKHNTDVGSNKEGMEKVNQGDYAFFMEATTIEYNIERECNLTQVGGLLDTKGYGIAVKKGNSKLRNWLSGGILQLQEDGVLHTFKEKWWKQKKGGGQCKATTSGSVNELGLGNVGGVILVMVLGLILSAIVGIVEFFWYQRKLRKDSETSVCQLFLREVIYAVTCGSSSKPAPTFKDEDELPEEDKPVYKSFT